MRKRLLLYFFGSVLASVQLTAQEEFIEPPSKFLTRLHFVQLTGGVILIEGQLFGYPDTLNFLLDTGSGGISLDSATALYLKLKPIPTDRTIRGIAGIRTVSFVNNQKLKFIHIFVYQIWYYLQHGIFIFSKCNSSVIFASLNIIVLIP